jgi:hypothetical protein
MCENDVYNSNFDKYDEIYSLGGKGIFELIFVTT